MPDHATTRHSTKAPRLSTWNSQEAAAHYAMDRWGKDYFSINEDGQLCVHPDRQAHRAIPLPDVLSQVQTKGLKAPLLLRFEDSIRDRIELLASTFQRVIDAEQFNGAYRLAYPIKVNQQADLIQQVIQHGQRHHFGLEAGSKAELMAVLGLSANTATPIFCNGFKDSAYIRTALLASKMGRPITVTIEKAHEAQLIAELCKETGARPWIGLRLKLHTLAEGRWGASSGQRSKFGLRYDECMKVISQLQGSGLSDCIRLLHAHLGSQLRSLDDLQQMTREMARIYVDLREELPALDHLDLGGGLGMDYDGAGDHSEDSIQYDLEDYARTLVQTIRVICDAHTCKHPTLITESGRALVAHHSMLLVNLMPEQIPLAEDDDISEACPCDQEPEFELEEATLPGLAPQEQFNRLQQGLVQIQEDFLNGSLNFKQRSHHEACYRQSLQDLLQDSATSDLLKDQLHHLLAPIAFANFSVFQSIPDSWALGQRSPIMPIDRLHEVPTRQIILGDLTCDSDGQISQFPGKDGIRPSLSIHEPNSTVEAYHLGIFMLGAYQEILGDMHNLFGDTHAVQLSFDHQDQWQIQQIVPGDTVTDMLDYVGIDTHDLINRLRTELDHARLEGRLAAKDAARLLEHYQQHLKAYTYLQ